MRLELVIFLVDILANFCRAQTVADFFNFDSQRKVERSRYLNEYDFIIVGSGPGGCVLANRLTENSKWNVLLIEAGKVETFFQEIPVMAAFMQSTSYNWGYSSEPQRGSCMGMVDQRCGLPRGRGLGGSSIINYMIYSRGHQDDYDRYAAAGNTGWSWKDVMPYFLRSEKCQMNSLRNSPFHNRNGWLSVDYNRCKTKIADAFVEAHKLFGMNEVDYNSGEQLGVSYLQGTTKQGRRHSAYKSFIEPILRRPNLHIMVNTRVTKILIDPNSKTAYGVEFLRRRKRFRVKARKEVILSSGTFSSPQLLMLSGVGPKEDLDRIGVEVIKDLPVGKVLNDHISHLAPTFIVNTTTESLFSDRLIMNPLGIFEFENGRGLMTIPGGVEALSFLRTKRDTGRRPGVPDVELILLSGGMHSDEGVGIRRGMRVTDEIYNKVYKRLESHPNRIIDTFTIMQMVFHPKSKGFIEIKSRNPFQWPKIYPNYLQHPDDVEAMLDGIKFAIKLTKTPPFQKLGARLHSIPLPNCAHIHFGSDDYWRCSIRTLASTLHHQISTCKMGPPSDPTAVVSPELKVHGISKLRVVDTSIIPESAASHTNAAAFMIGEKAADMIKREWMGQ